MVGIFSSGCVLRMAYHAMGKPPPKSYRGQKSTAIWNLITEHGVCLCLCCWFGNYTGGELINVCAHWPPAFKVDRAEKTETQTRYMGSYGI